MKHFIVIGTVSACVEAEDPDDAREKAAIAFKTEDVSREDMFVELDPEYHTNDEVRAFDKARDE